MKSKTSLTLSEDLLQNLDRLAGSKQSRSSLVERILRDFFEQRERARRDARQVAAINRHAKELNEEMSDALSFQAAVGGE
jgi:metal-responsive CopG/Arc/MetJ family transcriptional regulator